jgi:RecB family exonuclease
MASAMPRRLSATTVQSLRDCPYRFFARVALGLTEGNELDAELDNSDYGRWMHGLLYRFHAQRSGRDDRAELQAAAEAEQAALALDSAAMLPYRAAFDTFAEQYLDWQQQHEAEGWRFQSGETERRCAPPDLDGLVLDGRLDRVDRRSDGAAMLIDYKTGPRVLCRAADRRGQRDTAARDLPVAGRARAAAGHRACGGGAQRRVVDRWSVGRSRSAARRRRRARVG